MRHYLLRLFALWVSALLMRFFHAPICLKNNIPRVVFYHGLGDGQTAFMRNLKDEISVKMFESHIHYLEKHYQIVSLDDYLDQLEKRGHHPLPSKPYCIITFDDGLKSVLDFALPILKAKQMPFTVFVSTHVINNNHLLWLHLLGCLTEKLGEKTIRSALRNRCHFPNEDLQLPLNALLRKHIRSVHKEQLLEKIAQAYNIDIQATAHSHQLYLNWADLHTIEKNRGSIYSHTHQHLPLIDFPDPIIINELIESQQRLIHHGYTNQRCVAFPFGMMSDYGTQATDLALQQNHQYVVEVGDGVNSLQRMAEHKTISRIELGNCSDSALNLYTTIEILPLLKHRLRWLNRIFRKRL